MTTAVDAKPKRILNWWRKPVVITTNLSSRQMQGKYSEHILDRLRETSEVINFRGESLRRSPQEGPLQIPASQKKEAAS